MQQVDLLVQTMAILLTQMVHFKNKKQGSKPCLPIPKRSSGYLFLQEKRNVLTKKTLWVILFVVQILRDPGQFFSFNKKKNRERKEIRKRIKPVF